MEKLERKIIFSKLSEMLVKENHTTVAEKDIKESSELEKDLDLDSLETWEFVYEIEQEFGLNEMPTEFVSDKSKTITDYINYIQKYQK